MLSWLFHGYLSKGIIVITTKLINFIILILSVRDDLIDCIYNFAIFFVRLLMRRILIQSDRSCLILEAIVEIDASYHAATIVNLSLPCAKDLIIQAFL